MHRRKTFELLKITVQGTSLVVQWLRLHLPMHGGMGSIPGGRTKIPNAEWYIQIMEKKKYRRRVLPITRGIEALFYKGRSSRNYGSFIIINLGLSNLKSSQR